MDLAGDIGKPEGAASVAVGKLLVVQPQQGKKGRMQVIGVHLALDGLNAELIRCPVVESLFHAGPGEEHRVTGDVVVTAVQSLCHW